MPLNAITVGIIIFAVSGLPSLFMSRLARLSQRVQVSLTSVGAVIGLFGAFSGLSGAFIIAAPFPWPSVGNSFIGLDALSAFFLVPVFLIGGLGPVYGLGYWSQREKPRSGHSVQVFWGFIVAGMALLVTSRHAMAFLFGWETMALSAFFLISAENEHRETRKAGFVYLIATHVGTLSLFGLFSTWRWATGSFAFVPLTAGAVSAGVMNLLFLLSLLGFGMKAGIMPLHFWLPGAHSNAPSHVSALLSGVMIKMGIYGIMRVLMLMPAGPAFWGVLILVLGVASGLLGVIYALGQHDLKRLLAYHSIENIGIILMGLGVAMLGRSLGHPVWFALGMAGSLLHVWNHSLFKSLLFLGAGSVLRSAGTRQIDALGGLARAMPWTVALFLVGAVAICGLPPLNGFISEFLIYLGLMRSLTVAGSGGAAVAFAAPALAMIGALAVACFIKVFGVVFLGNPRTMRAAQAVESPWTMRLPMLVLAGACLTIGLAPGLVLPALDHASAVMSPGVASTAGPLATLVPLGALFTMSVLLLGFIAVAASILASLSRASRRAPTWDCGYASPTSRMQYTASSFAQSIVRLFNAILRPDIHQPQLDGAFPVSASMHSHVADGVLDGWLIPSATRLQGRFRWFHRFQQGLTQHYVLFIVLALVLLLGTLIPFKEIMIYIGTL
ncbi:MAG TPA: proton-conducting transporter membrane subunit [bacterium]|nr:proton-conducting transporter membrane subunit [bacterium]